MDRDPWYWDPGEVVGFFRDEAADIVPSVQRSRLPPSEDFFDALTSEGVTGDCLLTAIDVSSLREEFGIKSSMVRNAVWTCICILRRRSAGYAAQHALPAVQAQTPQSLPPANLPETPVQQLIDAPGPAAGEADLDYRVGENARSGEYQFQDRQGRKRRKLNLLTSGHEIQRVQPAAATKSYLPDTALSIDELFYGGTAFGEETGELQAAGNITVLAADREGSLEDNDFHFLHHDMALGEVEFVYKHMRHFLTSSEQVDMTRQGRPAVALLPYRQTDTDSRSATIVQYKSPEDEQPVAFRENALFLNSTVPEKDVEGRGEWDFLVEKYGAEDDEVLPGYGDSETALSDSRLTSTNSDSDSMAEVSVAPDELSNERASEFIDQTLKKYIDAWYTRLEALEKKKAYTVWNKMKRSRTIQQALIDGAHAQIERLRTRLQKGKTRILESQWRNDASLEQVCGTLQATAEDIEEQYWQIDVWKRQHAPPHSTRPKSRHRGHRQKPHASTEGGTVDRLVIPEHDQFSASPPPEGSKDDGAIDRDDSFYDADTERFHTPPAGASPDATAGAEQDESGAEHDTPFIVGNNVDEDDAATGLEDNAGACATPEGLMSDAQDPTAASDAESKGLPSPSTWRQPKREIKPSTPSKTQIMSIDLTADSPSSEAPSPGVKKVSKSGPSVSFLDDPNFASARDVDGWQVCELVKNSDRRRILIKILRDAGPDKRDQLHQCYMYKQKARFRKDLADTLVQLRREPDTFDDDQGSSLRLAAGIYLRWHFPALLTTATFADVPWDSALRDNQIDLYSGQLWAELQKRNTPKFRSPNSSSVAPGSSSANPQVLSSDNEKVASSPRTPSKAKKEKKKVEKARSQVGIDQRAKAVERHKKLALAESQSGNSSQLVAMVSATVSNDRSTSEIDINPTRLDHESPIFILDKIAAKIKPHQVSGVRFLWLEVVTSDDDSGGRGCVLAHTMGLGKTLQSIAFLAAVNEAAQSKEQAVRRQLPKRLRAKGTRGLRSIRTLILCPPGLIPNWRREIDEWAGRKLGNIYCLDSGVKQPGRLPMLNDWMRTGGVLILGYDLFRSLVSPDKGKGRKKKVPIPEDMASELESSLLDGPEIAIADEAHNLKSLTAGVTTACHRIKTEHKIALTGTPMSNDVDEVYALVSWTAPGYLGGVDEFNEHFSRPIKESIYKDSTRWQQRKGIMRLKGLHEEIKEKVNRANIEVLRGSIPPKVEFVIFVSLQPTQLELYKRFVAAAQGLTNNNDSEDVSNKKNYQTVFLSMLTSLMLLTNHPWCFKGKMLEQPKSKRAKSIQDRESESGDADTDTGEGRTPSITSGSATPLGQDITTTEQRVDRDAAEMPDEHVFAMGMTREMIQQILGGDGSDIGDDPSLSSKLTVFMSLLKSCLKAGEKSIVFSQRLGMLDYLGELFKRENIPYGRIDGRKTSDRLQTLAQFDEGLFDVCVVSTRAGGVGINMQCASRVFIFDFGFNPVYEEQAIGRAYRLGQKRHVYVYRFVASGTFETNIYNKQLLKTGLAQRVVDKKSTRRTAERNTREYLYEPKEVAQRNISDHIDRDPEVLGKLLKQHGSGGGKFDTMIRDVTTMETLTEEVLDEPLDQEEQKMMEQEAEARKQRAKGKKAVGAGMMPLPSTMPGMGGYMPPPPAPPNMMRPPSSTFAGSSNQAHPLGGLPTR